MKIKFFLAVFLLLNAFSSTFSQKSFKLTYEYRNIGLGEKRTVNVIVNGAETLTKFLSKDSIANSEQNDFDLSGEDQIGRLFYYNSLTREMVVRDFVSIKGNFTPTIVNDNVKPLNWEFTEEVKKFGKYSCKLVTTKFRGRTFNVWFTEDVALSHSLWKLNGLPGLIVYVESSDKNNSFLLKRIEAPSKVIIDRPINGKQLTIQQYVLYKKDAEKDFLNSLAARLPKGAQFDLSSVKDYNLEIDYSDVGNL